MRAAAHIQTHVAKGILAVVMTVSGTNVALADCSIHGVTLTEDQCKDYRKIESCFLENTGSRLSARCISESGGNPAKGVIGGGWVGNWLGYAKCHEVAGAFQDLVDRCLSGGLFSRELRPCSIIRGGIAEHVYAGICLNGVVISWTDPWRYGHGGLFPAGQGGHSTSHDTLPWIEKQVPTPTPTPTPTPMSPPSN